MAFRRSGFALTPPSIAFFVISVVLALVAFLVHYAGVHIQVINAARAFDLLAVGYIVLVVGVLFRGV
jgi:hypothetical protein